MASSVNEHAGSQNLHRAIVCTVKKVARAGGFRAKATQFRLMNRRQVKDLATGVPARRT
jgi:hypothetical protein